MSSFHNEKIEIEIAHIAADFFKENANRTSLITVTRADISPDGKNARIYISVFPEKDEQDALVFAKRNLSELRAYAASHARFKRVPFFEIVLDIGEKNRQAVQDVH